MTGGVSAWPRCAEIADAAQDPREGSAPPAEQWLLIEHPGPVGARPADPVGDRPAGGRRGLAPGRRRSNGRVLLIRRPGRPSRSTSRRGVGSGWTPGPAGRPIRTGTAADERELAAAVLDRGPALSTGRCTWSAPTAGTTPAARCAAARWWRRWPPPTRKRPGSARTWAAAGSPRPWCCCRTGYLFGGIPAADAVTLTKQYDAGLLDPRWLRGRSCHPPAVQAAQHHARAATGAFGVDALGVRSATRTGSSRWRVLLTDPDCAVELVERRVDAGRPLTCAATAPGWMRVFDLVGVESGSDRAG